MKSVFKIISAVLVSILCIYTACQKSNVTANQQTVDPQLLSSQIAVSFYNSIAGQYGGVNINGGIQTPANLTLNPTGPRINGLNSYCGYTIDTTYTNTATVHDTTKTSTVHFKFVYGCDGNKVDKYTVNDTIAISQKGALFANTSKVTQGYLVKALDQTYKLVSMDGAITTAFHNSTLNSAHATTEYHDVNTQYTLGGVKVDLSSGTADVTVGTATFEIQTTDVTPANTAGWHGKYSGTITFLGNHQAKLSLQINGDTKNFKVNLLTGVTTAI
jgi:hypothetical protein